MASRNESKQNVEKPLFNTLKQVEKGGWAGKERGIYTWETMRNVWFVYVKPWLIDEVAASKRPHLGCLKEKKEGAEEREKRRKGGGASSSRSFPCHLINPVQSWVGEGGNDAFYLKSKRMHCTPLAAVGGSCRCHSSCCSSSSSRPQAQPRRPLMKMEFDALAPRTAIIWLWLPPKRFQCWLRKMLVFAKRVAVAIATDLIATLQQIEMHNEPSRCQRYRSIWITAN